MVSWLTFGSKTWPQTDQSPIVTLPLLAASVFLCPSQKFTAPSANPARCWNHTINLFMVWTLCLYGFSAGCGWLMALCHDIITPCPIGAKKVGLVGAIFTPFKHLSAPPWQKKHRPHAPSSSSVAAGAVQVPYWPLPLQQWRRCWCDASMMLNSLINTINDN